MKRWFLSCFLTVFLWLIFFQRAEAFDYTISNFESQIRLEQDSSLTVTENIATNFTVPKHGIIRIIPYIYSKGGKTINANIKILGVSDEEGNKIPFTIDNFNQSRRIKIGNANKLVSGKINYFITYNIKGVVLDWGDGPEIYWNVTGKEWEVPIARASAIVDSPFGKITKINCYGCESSFTENQAIFDGKQGLTVVVQIDKENLIKMPGVLEKKAKEARDNFGYFLAIIPGIFMLIIWLTMGRDKKYLTENVFYEPEKKLEKNVPLTSRPHLPLVYGPIDGLTPGQVGTIIDEKFDTKDAVAEIMELARLGYLTIKKLETKGFLGIVSRDYELTKTDKTTEKLKKYQEYLLESLFNIDIGIEAKTKLNEQIAENTGKKIEPITIKVSDLNDHFYIHLEKLREKIYQQMVLENMMADDPGAVKAVWMTIAIVLNTLMIWVVVIFFAQITNNGGPVLVGIIGAIISIVFAWNMPRKTAKGYSLYRQATGLKYYLSKGKWREEIAEKHLFLEEMLPLAITLGIVDQLAKDMEVLGIEPPKYFEGSAMNTFAYDLYHFSSSASSGLTTAPSKYSGSGTWSGGSGSGSWSGGSGFSGGFSGGGGFGGGGGGSW